MTQPQPDRKDIHERVASLPLVEGGEILDEKAALATFEDLKRSGSQIPEHIGRVISTVVGEVSDELDEGPDHDFQVSASMLRGIVARAAIRGASQTASDLGHTQRDINHLHSLFPDLADQVLPFPGPDTPDQPPAPAA